MGFFRRLFVDLLSKSGYTLRRLEKPDPTLAEKADRRVAQVSKRLDTLQIDRAHYGCGRRLLPAPWMNFDILRPPAEPPENFLELDLTTAHPIPSNYFAYAYAEDFIEHLSQADSLLFLGEAYRTLQPGGVLRLSFPGLEEVLAKHFRSGDFNAMRQATHEAYDMWEHTHFYTRETLAAVAGHIGFKQVDFHQFAYSDHCALAKIDSRADQRDLNIFAELRK